MTDEEAIKRIKLLQQDECDCIECQKDKEALTIVLNLIERQQKEIEYWKYKCDKEVSENIVNITKIVNQNNRINELEKTLIDERLKHSEEMKKKEYLYQKALSDLVLAEKKLKKE